MEKEKINVIVKIDIDTLNILKELNISVDDYFTEESQIRLNAYRMNKQCCIKPNNDKDEVKDFTRCLKFFVFVFLMITCCVLVSRYIPDHNDTIPQCNSCLGGHY